MATPTKKLASYGYYVLIFASIVAIAVVLLRPSKAVSIPELKERKGNIALGAEWLNTRDVIDAYVNTIRKNPKDYQSKVELAQAYIQEGRVTGDHPYYDAAALTLVEDVLKAEPQHFEALCSKATILMSQHHFVEALEVAKVAVKLHPEMAFVWGLLTDANVELGRYPEAVAAVDRMVSLRPDLKSYARVSYLREIHGDMPGAIDAMTRAVKAGVRGLEQTAWVRTQLAHLYENTGDTASARKQYNYTLEERPTYAYAHSGVARLEKLAGNYAGAIAHVKQADGLTRDYGFKAELVNLYRLAGQEGLANSTEKEVAKLLNADANPDDREEQEGHYSDLELANHFLQNGAPKDALEPANREYKRRPGNIDAAGTMAWALYSNGNTARAASIMDSALRTNSKNPLLMYRAGQVYKKAGQTAKGDQLIQSALAVNPQLVREPAAVAAAGATPLANTARRVN